jgi:hypothetical protein
LLDADVREVHPDAVRIGEDHDERPAAIGERLELARGLLDLLADAAVQLLPSKEPIKPARWR